MAIIIPSMYRGMLLVIAISVMISTVSSLGENNGIISPPRRRVYFGSMDALQRPVPDSLVVSATARSRRILKDDDYSVLDVARRRTRQNNVVEETDDEEEEEATGNKLWPPWPFNLLTQRGSKNGKNGRDDAYRSNGSLFWAYFRQRLLITKRQFQHGEDAYCLVSLVPRIESHASAQSI